MGNDLTPFSDIGKRAKDVLTKDYNFDKKFTLSFPSFTGMVHTGTVSESDPFFVSDIQYKNGNIAFSGEIDNYRRVSTRVSLNDKLKAALRFNIPYARSGKLDVQWLHHHATIGFSIGLYRSPHLGLSTTLGTKHVTFGGEVGFDTASSSFTKYDAGISVNETDFSAAVIVSDKGNTVKASYSYYVNPLKETEVAAELTRSIYGDSFTIGSSHAVNPCTKIKARLSDNGKVALLWQREFWAKHSITLSSEFDAQAINAVPKFGLAISIETET